MYYLGNDDEHTSYDPDNTALTDFPRVPITFLHPDSNQVMAIKHPRTIADAPWSIWVKRLYNNVAEKWLWKLETVANTDIRRRWLARLRREYDSVGSICLNCRTEISWLIHIINAAVYLYRRWSGGQDLPTIDIDRDVWSKARSAVEQAVMSKYLMYALLGYAALELLKEWIRR